ncbi:MAG: hypothetical protein JWQ25_499 [Daejeonella sp.]|nr:hypothetical protein [Daejeonella sp.]
MQLGWVTSIQNINAVTTKLNEIYLQQDMLLSISERAPEIIRKDYDSTFLTNTYIDYYKSVVNQRLA